MNTPNKNRPNKLDPEVNSRWEFARRIALEAGQLTLRYFWNDDLLVDRKEDNSPVTEADRGAEILLRERISDQFPQDAILGEEFGLQDGTSGFQWILDPIDGTKSFISGVPLYSTLVGVARDGESVAGVIELPALDQRVHAAIGQGAWLERASETAQQARVSDCRTLAEARFLTSSVKSFGKQRGPKGEEAYARLQQATWISRTWGDAYGYMLVATGRAELMVDPAMSPWDAGPLPVILEEAGGAFTDWKGKPNLNASEGLATNGHLLADVLAITAS